MDGHSVPFFVIAWGRRGCVVATCPEGCVVAAVRTIRRPRCTRRRVALVTVCYADARGVIGKVSRPSDASCICCAEGYLSKLFTRIDAAPGNCRAPTENMT